MSLARFSGGQVSFLQLTLPIVGAVLVAPFLGLLLADGGKAVAPSELGFRGTGAFLTTLAWSIGIAVIAWSASLAVTGPRRSLRLVWMSITLVGLLVPASLWFDAWWLEVGPSTGIGRAAAEGQWVPLLRRGVLSLGLLGVAVPLAIWIRAGQESPEHDSLRLLDRPGGWRWLAERWRDRWRMDGAAIAVLAIFTAGLTIPFDLAQVGSIGFELRSLDVRGASPATILLAGWPMIVSGMVGALLVTAGLPDRAGRRRPDGRGGGLIGWLLVFVFVLIPSVILVRRALGADIERSLSLHLPAMAGSSLVAGAGMAFGALVATSVCVARIAGGRAARAARAVVFVAVLLALLPATIVAVGLEALWNRSATASLYDGPFTLLTGVAARVAVAPALVGWVVAVRSGRSLLALDRPAGWPAFLKSVRPALTRASIAGGVVGGALAFGEIPVSSRLQPPGFPVLNTALLNAMHYQYVDSVLPAVLVMLLAVALAAGVLVLLFSGRDLRPGSSNLLLVVPMVLAGLVTIPGCDGAGTSAGIAPIEHRTIFGRPGNLEGRFDYPRAIAVDGARKRIYVVDKSARIQRFDLDGTLQASWRMPAYDNGKPTGLNVAPNGNVLVADTHEHRVTIFSPDGELLATHGALGEEAGQFIYPTDVVAGPNGTWFVSEYGGNDRIQIFDRDWSPIGVIGFAGEHDAGDRPALARPQSMVWDDERQELLIADAVHHRIVVTDASGRLKRTFGAPGRGAGQLSYPYDLALLEDGALMVVEYGNNRIQRFDPITGRATGVWGGEGVDPGRVRYPWGLDAKAGLVVVLDSGNSRVMVGDAP